MARTIKYFGIILAFLFPFIVSAQQQPNAAKTQENNKVAVIRFLTEVNPNSVGALLQVVDGQYKSGIRRFVILIASPGGDVLSGLMAYNYLKGLPIELTTFNIGNVDSSAGLIYCAGTKRYAVPESRFVIHEVSLTLTASGPGTLNIALPDLESQMVMLKSQEDTMAKILAATVGKPQADAESKIHAQKSLSADEAKQWGLVQDIRTKLFDPSDSILVMAVPPQNQTNPFPSTPSGVPIMPPVSYSSGTRNPHQ